jgi:nicotinate-nucleotide--dimethylbenzimidazole phosphoribosyltransferase
MDGTGAALAWPLVKNAAALLTDVADGEDPGPTLPQDLDENDPTAAFGPALY